MGERHPPEPEGHFVGREIRADLECIVNPADQLLLPPGLSEVPFDERFVELDHALREAVSHRRAGSDVVYDAHDDGAKQGADNAACAAEEVGPTDDDDGDAVQLRSIRHQGVGGVHAADQHQASDGSQKPQMLNTNTELP